jgi:phosphatidylinositol-3-phosphatase
MKAGQVVPSAALACALTLGAGGCSSTGESPTAATSSGRQPGTGAVTGTPARTTPRPARAPALRGPGAVTKVLVFVEENHSVSEMMAEMPFTVGLGRRFGYATHYTAVSHPSLPNYIAIAGGQTYGITNDDPPEANPVRRASVFGQAVAAGRTASVYADGMPGNCATSDGGTSYAVRHNPWAYFVGRHVVGGHGVDEHAACLRYDVPIGQLDGAIARGALPNVGMVVPNLCHDAHDCSLGTADTWFKGWMGKVFQGPDWKSGRLAVVLTADEDDRSAGNTVLTVVIHPSQRSHVVTTALTHYSLTRLYQEVAGLPYQSGAVTAPSMATAFGLPLS